MTKYPSLPVVQTVAEVHTLQLVAQAVGAVPVKKYPSPGVVQTVPEVHTAQPVAHAVQVLVAR